MRGGFRGSEFEIRGLGEGEVRGWWFGEGSG